MQGNFVDRVEETRSSETRGFPGQCSEQVSETLARVGTYMRARDHVRVGELSCVTHLVQ